MIGGLHHRALHELHLGTEARVLELPACVFELLARRPQLPDEDEKFSRPVATSRSVPATVRIGIHISVFTSECAVLSLAAGATRRQCRGMTAARAGLRCLMISRLGAALFLIFLCGSLASGAPKRTYTRRKSRPSRSA
jgi:hypothetical protein